MKIDLAFLKNTFPNGKEVQFRKQDIIAWPHQKVTHFLWLIHGQISYYIPLNHSRKEILVSKISRPFMPVGWGGFNSPHRFALKLVASKDSVFFQVDMQDLLSFTRAGQNPFIIRQINEALHFQMQESVKMQLKKLEPSIIAEEPTDHENYFISTDATEQEIITFLRRSPFLGNLEEHDLAQLASGGERRDFERGELVIEQDKPTDGIHFLIQGEIAIRRSEGEKQLNMRSISTPGFIFGWSALVDKPDIFDTITTTKSSVYFIPKREILKTLEYNDDLSTKFYFRLVWLLGNQLNISFIKYLNLRINHDVLAVQNMITNAKSKLMITSLLHQVPHLLKALETKPSAFEILHQVTRNGHSLERHLSSISLDLLRTEEKEVKFVDGLRTIYQEVVEKNPDNKPEDVRIACAKATHNVFKGLKVSIRGWDNLPDRSGHIFIYNHLLNHPYYTLENNFQITLDAHFISSEVLYKRYGEPGIRTVRIGKGEEYGHQDYYERLGYINVFTKDSNHVSDTKKEISRKGFYRQANHFLDNGHNLIISPEGTSFTTEESPGPFKSGAFRLAFQRKQQTLIVPILLRNFDKRITHNTFDCRILEPIDLKEVVSNEISLQSFIEQTRNKFLEYLK